MGKFLFYFSVLFTVVGFQSFSVAASAQMASTNSTNIEVTDSSNQSSVDRIGVTLDGVELEDTYQRESKSRGLNPVTFREELVDTLKELRPGTIQMEFPDLGPQLADHFSASGAAVSRKSTSGSGYGLGEFLQLCAQVGSDPWLRIPSGTTPQQMQELVEYLSGTGSDAWSAARIGDGQAAPWTQVFGKIHIELDNESGSVATASEQMQAVAYAERANADYGAARQTTGFDGSKFDLILSAAGTSAEWTAAVLGQSREQDSVAIAADLPLRDGSVSQAELYGTLLAEPQVMDSAGGVVSHEVADLTRVAGSTASRGTGVNVERSQLSVTAGGAEQVAQSWGAGLAQAEHLLQMMAMGVRYQNGEILTENSLHCTDGSQASDCRSSQFLTEALANAVIGGTMLQTAQTGANPSWFQVLNGKTVQAHALQSFAFAEGGKVSLVIFNLSRTAELPVTVSGENAPGGDVQMAQIAPGEITDSNKNGTSLQQWTQTLSASDVNGLSLPPYSMTVLSWEAGSESTNGLTESGAGKVSSTKVLSTMVKPNGTRTLIARVVPSASTTSSSPVINCPSGFSSSGACGVSFIGSSGQKFTVVGANNYSTPELKGSQIDLIPSGAVHTGLAVNYITPVNVQSFSTTFTFVPNGWNIAFVLQNNTVTAAAGTGPNFASGAGCEAGFYQAFDNPFDPPNNIFALELDQQSPLTNANGAGYGAPFTYSSVQIYKAGQSPCNPNDLQPDYYYTQKISTSPVSLNSPANAIGTTTGDTYSVTLNYSGTTLVMNMYDVTAGGSCPGPSCFTYTWTGVNIPALVGSNTAYLGFTGGTNQASTAPLYVNSLVYTVGSGSTPTAATPAFSVAAGTYTTAQTVSISDATSGATIYYTTNGTVPTTSSTKYDGPITVSATETLKAIAVKTGYTNSPVATAAYTIDPVLPAPVFSVASGTYTSAQTVSISDATAGTTLYYTTNGSAPTTSSTRYSGPIMVSTTETLEAIAVKTSYTNSPVATAAYSIDPALPAPLFSVAPGTYTSSQMVSISDATAGTTIYYTTNGSAPTTSSARYGGAITVNASEILKAIAVKTGYTNSPVATAAYTIDPVLSALPVLPAPVFSVASGTYTSVQTVSISDATADTTIYYTTNGSAPTTSSIKYSGPIMVSVTETLKAIAIKTGYTNSPVATATYTISGATAAITAAGTTYINYPTGGFTATGLTLQYGAEVTGGLLQLTDGGGYESRSAWSTTAVPVSNFSTDFTFQQLNATADGMTFTIQSSSSPVQGVAGGGLGYQNIPHSVAVKFDLFNNAGEGNDSTGLYIDGAVPAMPAVDLSSTPIDLHSGHVMHAHLVYNGTNLTMTLTDTVTGGSVTEAFAVDIPSIVGGGAAYVGFTGGTGGATSTQNILSWTYSSPNAMPTFSPAGGSYASAQSVTISATPGTTIYYTTNGTTPTTSSIKYSGPITVSATETLKAIAVNSGGLSSAVATANYGIEPGGTTYINYPTGGFTDTATGLTLQYGAKVTGGLLQLTDGGTNEGRSAWSTTAVPVSNFSTDFTFQQLNATGDGMTFTIQSSSSPIQGATGGGLGYQNIPHSVAVKFDLYNNAGEGTDSTGLYTDGAFPGTPSIDLSSTPINLHRGDVMHAHLVYDGTNLTMTLTDTVTGGSVTEAFAVNIPSIVGGNTAYVGFTGGTGGATSTQNILSWTFVGPTEKSATTSLLPPARLSKPATPRKL